MDIRDGKSQINYSILNTLLSGDKYGYEIIDSAASCGVVIKQPTLYGALKRLEEQGCISSYWRDSEIGGRRHYYRITDYGRKSLQDIEQKSQLSTHSSAPTRKTTKNTNLQTPSLLQTNIFDLQGSISFSPADFSDDLSKQCAKQPQINTNECQSDNSGKKDDGVFLPKDLTYQSISKTELNTNSFSDATLNNATENNSQQTEHADFDVFSHIDKLKKHSSFSSASSTNAYSGMVNEPPAFNKLNFNNELSTGPQQYESNSEFVSLHSPSPDQSLLFSNKDDNSSKNASNSCVDQDLICDRQQLTIKNVANEEVSLQKNEPIVDDARLITERIDRSELMRGPSLKPSLSVKAVENKLTQAISNSKTAAYKDLVLELYDSAKNDDTSSMTDSNNVSEIHNQQLQNVSYKPYTPLISKNKSDSGLKLVNIFKHFVYSNVMTGLYLIACTLIIYFVISNTVGVNYEHVWLYFMPLVVWATIFCLMAIFKGKNKYKCKYANENTNLVIYAKCIVMIALMLSCYAINVAVGLSHHNLAQYATSLFLPIICFISLPLSSLFELIAKKIKFMH